MNRSKKLIIIGASVIVALLLAFGIYSLVKEGKSPDSPTVDHGIMYYYSQDDNATYFFVDDVKLKHHIAGAIDSYTTSDGTAALVRAATALYRVDEEGILLIYPAAVTKFLMTFDNNQIFFATATKLFMYDHTTGEQTEITGIDAKSIISIAGSPNGDTFAASVLDADGRAHTYKIRDCNAELMNDDSCIVAISDDGEFSYYMEFIDSEPTGKLLALKDGKTSLIGENVESVFELNRDISEITFDIGEKTHYSKNGSKAKKLLDSSVFSSLGERTILMGGDHCTVHLKNTSTLFDGVFFTYYAAATAPGSASTIAEYDLYYINAAHNAVKLAGGVTQYDISPDGKTVLCLADDDLYRVSVYNPQRPELIASNVYSYSCSERLDHIYIWDMAGVLSYLNADGSFTSLLSNVAYSIITKDNVCLVITGYEDGAGTLNWVISDETGVIANEVSDVISYAGITLYFVNSDEEGYVDVYTSGDSVSFTLSLENMKKNEN